MYHFCTLVESLDKLLDIFYFQMRLLSIDEKYRSQFLYDQIESFEEKVYRSFEQFNVEFLYMMYTKLLKKTVVDTRKVRTLGHVRQCHKDLQKLIRCRKAHRNIAPTEEEEAIVNYFNWFFHFWNYLRQLRYNFCDRVFTPLFRYFYHIGYDRPEREDTTDSATSSPSVMSFRSHDSGVSDLSGLTSVLGGDFDRLSVSLSARSSIDETQKARRKIVTRNALLALSKEFQDIKKLYDTTEIEKLAQRLSHLKERTDQLLDNENSLDKDLLCQDSERSVFNLKIKDIGSYNVMRLVPDVLLKYQKASWLARRWLEQDDEKTKDLNAKLDKLTNLEEEMNRRLQTLSKEIQLKETELESQADRIASLLKKEDRSNDLSESMFVLNKNKAVLQDQLNTLNKEKEELSEKLRIASEKNDSSTYRKLKPFYDKNKLQRFALERQIATLNYRINIVESDMNVEFDVKADVIHTTNDMQDKCEELEQTIEKAKKEKKAIQAALIPISEDRKYVSEQIELQNDPHSDSDEEQHPVHHADYIKTTKSPKADLRERRTSMKTTGGGNNTQLPVFITSLPTERRRLSVDQHLAPVSPRKSQATLSPVQHTIVSHPMKTLSPVGTPSYVPQVCASEW